MARLDIKDRVVLITGGGQGIGRELVRETLDRGGVPVVVEVDRSLEEQIRAQIGNRGAAHFADVRDAEAMARIVEETVAAYGRLDVVLANAGIERIGPVWDMPAEDFEAVIEINVLGAYRTMKPALPHVIKAGGHLLTIASVAAVLPQPVGAAYSASKAAVDMMMRIIRMDLAGTGASAGAAYFGIIPTKMGDEVAQNPVIAQSVSRLPGRLLGVTPPPSAATAARKIMDGVERRSPRVYAPWMIRFSYLIRGLLAQGVDFQTKLMGVEGAIRAHYGAPKPPEAPKREAAE
ncbi:MAG: SDR family NAD(P)-dependent oxidoreductase [Pseudomonadota bacterium]